MSSKMWGKHSLSTETTWKTGSVALRVKGVKDELWVSSLHGKNNAIDFSEEDKWSRWALKKKTESFKLTPLFPDKSIVVKPESPFRLMPGVEAKIYVRVPIWLGIKLNEKATDALTEIPSAILSLTWFGSTVQGELCYWISSSARRDVVLDSERDHLVICPVQLKNSSDEILLVEKLCLRVKWLSIYQKDQQLWANETKISYRGGADMSQITVSSSPPKEANNALLVSPPREIIKKSFSMKTFFPWGSE